jgi:hypothetical protein
MIVIQAHARACHQPSSGFGQRGFKDKSAIVCVLLPGAEVFDKTTRIIRRAGDNGAPTQAGEIQINARPQLSDFVLIKKLSNAHGAIALILLHEPLIDHAASPASISSINAAPR